MVKVELLSKSAGKLIGNLVHGIHDSDFFFLCEGQREQFLRGRAIFQVLQLFQGGEMGISQFPDIIELRDDALKCFRIFLLTACLPCGAFVLMVREGRRFGCCGSVRYCCIQLVCCSRGLVEREKVYKALKFRI